MKNAVCPELQDLERLVLGQVSAEELAALERHLAHCPRCAVTLSQIRSTDTLRAHGQGQATAAAEREFVSPAALALETDEIAEPTGETDAISACWREVLSPPEQPDELGRLGGYRILAVLGIGGMGIVFQAEDVQLKRAVALKVMKPLLAANEWARRRFLREARAVAALMHDHIVPIFQVGEGRGVPFLAMPLLPGESLLLRLEKVPPPSLCEIIQVGRQVAEGLAAAHERGLVHRDIKPANIWLETQPRAPGGFRVKLLDFGLARGADEPSLTDPGVVLGTPAYMSPEQARGEDVDARTDLFSLGCLLYRLCTGRLPFKGIDPSSTLVSLIMDEPAPPRQLAPDVPARLSDLVMRLLAKDPENRPASASDVALALAGIDADLAQMEKSVGAPKKAMRRWYVIAASLLLLIGAAWAGQIALNTIRGDGATPNIEPAWCNPSADAGRDLPARPIFSCDFTDGQAHGTRSFRTGIVDRKIWGSNEGHLMRFYNTDISWMEADFEHADSAPANAGFDLCVKHLASSPDSVRHGYSPVVVTLNGQEVWKGNPAQGDLKDGEWTTVTVNITRQMRPGTNTLRWDLQPEATTHYWLKSFQVKRAPEMPGRKNDGSKEK